ncbi:MAG: hypothetical protein LUG57_07795, partial [Oscillospiraceae bacterium]|nr:hypothetical protein [Oscillospiraceae bacterium]
ASDMFYAPLADRVHYFKETEGGSQSMSGVFEEIRREAAEKAAKEAAAQAEIIGAIDMARYFNSAEDDIKRIIMEKYDLDESTADSYLLKKSA